MKVALVTAAPARQRDEDLLPLSSALAASGVEPSVVDWDDPAVDWSGFDLVVIRSTWDYTGRLEEFLGWVDRVADVTPIENPAPVLHWNTDKRYLRDLEQAAVPTVPTVFVEPGERPMLPPVDVVVKPAVSAGARDTVRFVPAQRAAARAQAERIHATGRTVMIQPYLDSVERDGETALVYVDGELSHAFRKGPILVDGARMVDDLYAEEHIAARTPSEAELEVGRAALEAAGRATGVDRLLYARVDLLADADGSPVVLEIELTEPSLFHQVAPGSVERLAEAIAHRR